MFVPEYHQAGNKLEVQIIRHATYFLTCVKLICLLAKFIFAQLLQPSKILSAELV